MTDPMARMPAGASAEAIRTRLAAEIGVPSWLGHTGLLAAGAGMAALSGALLISEEALPAHTRAALLAIFLIAVAWATFAVWVLWRRRILLATHRVVAARMAVTFTGLFTGAAIITGFVKGFDVAAIPAGTGLLMLAAAVVLHSRASRMAAKLERRRAELERLLADYGSI